MISYCFCWVISNTISYFFLVPLLDASTLFSSKLWGKILPFRCGFEDFDEHFSICSPFFWWPRLSFGIMSKFENVFLGDSLIFSHGFEFDWWFGEHFLTICHSWNDPCKLLIVSVGKKGLRLDNFVDHFSNRGHPYKGLFPSFGTTWTFQCIFGKVDK